VSALYHPLAHTKANYLMKTMLSGSSNPSEGHKRNCILIACYLGLSQHTIENIPFDSTSKTRPCPTCGRRVTLGNFAGHVATHDPEKKYNCDTCPYKTSRSDNFASHERSCRRRRPAYGSNEGLSDAGQPLDLVEEVQPQTSTAFPEMRQFVHSYEVDPRDECSAPLQQHPGVLEAGVPYLVWGQPYRAPAIPHTMTTLMSETPNFSSLPLQSDWATDGRDPSLNAGYNSIADPHYGFFSDPSYITPQTVSLGPNLWDRNQYNANLDITGETVFGHDPQTFYTANPLVAANTTMYNPYLDTQSLFIPSQNLGATTQWPSSSVEAWGTTQDPLAQANLNSSEVNSTSLLPFAGQPLYQHSFQDSLSGSTKRKSPSYPTDDGSDRATRLKTGFAGQDTWLPPYSS
jgi:hypothetical protein